MYKYNPRSTDQSYYINKERIEKETSIQEETKENKAGRSRILQPNRLGVFQRNPNKRTPYGYANLNILMLIITATIIAIIVGAIVYIHP